jgi:tetratricopeptide (TPR) repeat protein
VLLAQVYEGEGKSQKARELYASLVGRVDPNPWHVTMYVDFLLRQPDLDGAKTWLDHLERHPDARESLGTARRKAQWLRAKGRTSEIESLVEGLAKRLLEKCKDDEETAQLASAVGNLYTTVRMHRAAVPWFQRLVSSPEPDAAQLAQYVDVLLRSAPRNESDDAWLKQEAATWLDKLEKLAPDKLTTAGLRARWLHARARTPEIEPLVEGVAAKLLAEAGDDQEQKARLALAIGGLYSTVEQHEAAKRWYEKLQGINRDVFAPLAMSLVQEGRMSEAITVCLQAAKSGDSARAAKILASLLVPPNRPDPEDFAQAEPLLARALKEHEDDFPLHFAVANVRIAQGRRDDAIGLYEKVLKSEPNHLLALNNLATLKSESDTAGDRQKAMGYVDRAIRVAGELPPLLDTKAMIFVYDGKPGQAVPLLKKATQMENADPRFHFHLAAAYDGLQNKKEAEAALTKARAGKVRDQFLTEKDEKLLQKLENKYPQPEAGKAS